MWQGFEHPERRGLFASSWSAVALALDEDMLMREFVVALEDVAEPALGENTTLLFSPHPREALVRVPTGGRQRGYECWVGEPAPDRVAWRHLLRRCCGSGVGHCVKVRSNVQKGRPDRLTTLARVMQVLEQEVATDVPNRKLPRGLVGCNCLFGKKLPVTPPRRKLTNIQKPEAFGCLSSYTRVHNLRVFRIPFAKLDWRGCLKWGTLLEEVKV